MFAIAMTCRFFRQRLRSVYWSRETITDIAMNDASERGGLKLIEFMLDEGAEKEDFDPAFCIELAAGGGHLDVIEFFLDLEPVQSGMNNGLGETKHLTRGCFACSPVE